MKGLTLWRPWDTAILCLGKPLENRDWPCPPALVGQRIALHSGKKFDEEGACRVVELCAAARFPTPEIVKLFLDRAERVHSAIIGTVLISRVLCRAQPGLGPPDPLASSPWFFGDYGWVCDDPWLLPTPVSCKGMQGLWTLLPDVEAAVLKQEYLPPLVFPSFSAAPQPTEPADE